MWLLLVLGVVVAVVVALDVIFASDAIGADMPTMK